MGPLDEDPSPVTDLGYYFTDWIWRPGSTDFMKSMLLFFDGLTLALPSNLAAEMIDRDPVLATPLAECGLLVNFDPADTLAPALAERLATALTEFVHAYPFESRQTHTRPSTIASPAPVGTITGAHWGGFEIPQANQFITGDHWGQRGNTQRRTTAAAGFESALAERGLIKPSARRGLYDMPAEVRLLILAVFAQALRLQLGTEGIVLHLATDNQDAADGIVDGLRSYIRSVNNGGPGPFKNAPDILTPSQLKTDLQDVGADLSAVPLDEVLAFRAEHRRHYRAYVKGLRELVVAQAMVDRNERRRMLHERRLEIKDLAADLRHVSRRAFGARMATLLASIAGAAWTLHTGDPTAALLSGAAAGLQAAPVEGETITAYSYLIKARNLGNR